MTNFNFWVLFCTAHKKLPALSDPPLRIFQGHANIVALLLELGLRGDALDSHKDSPLHLSAMRGHFGVSELLLETHAEDRVKALLLPNGAGFTVYHLVGRAGKMQRSS